MRDAQQSLLNNTIQVDRDSLVRTQLASTLEQGVTFQSDEVTDMILFDTDKAASDSTGLRPIKAIIRRWNRQEMANHHKSQTNEMAEIQVSETATENYKEQSEKSFTTQKTPSTGISTLRLGVGIFLLAISAFLVYCKLKR